DSADLFPRYIHSLQTSGIIQTPKTRSVGSVADPVYCVTHFNVNSYGHFLLECLPKLLVVDYLYEIGHRFPIIIPTDLPQFARSIIRKVSEDFILLDYDVTAPLEISRILLPTMCQLDYIFHPFF